MCNCKICTYYRLFKKHIENVPEESKGFFNQLYDYYSMAEEEKEWLGYKLDNMKEKVKC